jgi:phosphoglycerol transferase
MVGRDLLGLPEEVPGRAMMQFYKTNAFRVEDRVVIHQPDRPALQFRYRDGRLEAAEPDPELVKDALAHIHLPASLYLQRRYRLPAP